MIVVARREEETAEQPEMFPSRTVSDEAMKQERGFASTVGWLCEKPLMSLCDGRLENPPQATIEDARAYRRLMEQMEPVLQHKTLRKTTEVIRLYRENGLLSYGESSSKHRQRGINQVPANADLARLLDMVDGYVRFPGARSLSGVYQSLVAKSEGGNLHPYGRFVVNAVVVLAREILARTTNQAVGQELGRWFQVPPTQLGGDDTRQLFKDILVGTSQLPGRLQFDAVIVDITTEAFKAVMRDAPLDAFYTLNAEWLLELPNSWAIVNMKLVGDTTLITGKAPIRAPRARDLVQLYDQLSSAIYNFAIAKYGETAAKESYCIHLPNEAVFLYARPFRQLAQVRMPLDRDFFAGYTRYLEEVLETERLDAQRQAQLREIKKFVVNYADQLPVKSEAASEPIFDSEPRLEVDVEPLLAAWANMMTQATETVTSRVSVSSNAAWDSVLAERRKTRKKKTE